MKIPNTLIPEAYAFSKKVFEEKLTMKEAQDQFVGDNRINPNSAADYFHNFKYLMQGRRFARTLNAFSMDYFINGIFRDYGKAGLQNALKALKLHIEYYEALQKTTMHKMREIYNKYSGIQDNDRLFERIDTFMNSEKSNLTDNKLSQVNRKILSDMNLSVNNLDVIVKEYMSKVTPEHRFASYDYCYNYFFSADPNDLTKDIEKSCYTLGFYLASWGMLRPSSFLLNKSVKSFESTIHYIASLDKSAWKIDMDSYPENIGVILNIYSGIKNRLINNGNADLTLITKILLGVFGFIPAFDNYFCNAFRNLTGQYCNFRKVDINTLEVIHAFYLANKSSIDRISSQIFTIDFLTEDKTKIKYTKAKVIDMYGFKLGQRK